MQRVVSVHEVAGLRDLEHLAAWRGTESLALLGTGQRVVTADDQQ
jgi:hypothetical protein